MLNNSLFRRSWGIVWQNHIINNGKVIKDDTKINLLKIISNKTVLFQINSEIFLPNELKNYNPKIENGNLKITYDKNIISLKEIINILNKNKISFQEINTYESDLEDIFIKLVKGIWKLLTTFSY